MAEQDNGRAAAQTFLDLAQVFDFGGDSVMLAAQQFITSGAVTVDFDADSQQLDLDLSRLIIGALAVIKPLLSITATNWGMSEGQAVDQLRRLIDESLG